MQQVSKRGNVSLFFMLIFYTGLTGANAQSVQLRWRPNTEMDVKYYHLYRDTIPGPSRCIATVPAHITSFIDRNVIDGQIYYYRITAEDTAHNQSAFSKDASVLVDNYIAVPQKEIDLARSDWGVRQNYPNPFNSETNIIYTINQTSDVKISIFNLLGRPVRTLFEGMREPGIFLINWDGTNDFGKSVSSGVYFILIKKNGSLKSHKVNLLR